MGFIASPGDWQGLFLSTSIDWVSSPVSMVIGGVKKVSGLVVSQGCVKLGDEWEWGRDWWASLSNIPGILISSGRGVVTDVEDSFSSSKTSLDSSESSCSSETS